MAIISHDSETPAHGQQVFSAVAFIHHNFDGITKVFLPKRAATKKFLPDVYEMPGGHIDYGEKMIVGLKREIDEELGVQVTIGDAFFVFDYTNEIKGSHSIEVAYFATLVSDPAAIKLNAEDHSTAGWFSKDEVAETRDGRPLNDDPEYHAILKGFALLAGESLNTA